MSAVPHRIPWWYGVGTRAIPEGGMWSASGLDTVLLTFTNGTRFLIWRDDSDGLAAALFESGSLLQIVAE